MRATRYADYGAFSRHRSEDPAADHGWKVFPRCFAAKDRLKPPLLGCF